MERTFIAIKPDGVQRGLIGKIITRFEQKGFKIIGLKMLTPTKEMAEKHYEEHLGKPFYPRLIRYITSGPIIAMVIEGVDAVASSRKLMGKTAPKDSEPGTIRFDYALTKEVNVIHGSDSIESAEREIGIYFKPDELSTWGTLLEDLINEFT